MRCCRAGARLALSAVPSVTRSVEFSLPKPEEAMAVPVGPGHRLGDLGKAGGNIEFKTRRFLGDAIRETATALGLTVHESPASL